VDTGSITAEALNLPVSERTELIEKLLHSLDPSRQNAIDQAWLTESHRRYAEYQAGKVETIDGEAALQEIERELRK
jgi:putative addiction module component (TIGR02574 family)